MFGQDRQSTLQAKCTLILLIFVVPVALETPGQAVKNPVLPGNIVGIQFYISKLKINFSILSALPEVQFPWLRKTR